MWSQSPKARLKSRRYTGPPHPSFSAPTYTNASQYFAALTVSADGYASNFRKRCTQQKPEVRSTFVGLQLIDAPLPSPYHGHVIMGSNPPVLLYQIGTHETRALIDMPALLPAAELKEYLLTTVLPDLPAQLQPSFKAALAAPRLPSMPNSYFPASPNATPGIILLGDAMNMRHPLTGGGMTVAFHDVVVLSRLLDPTIVPDLSNTDLVLEQMRTFHWERKNLSGVVNVLAQALYSLFAANDSELRVLQRGCFAYFKRGGNCVTGPVGLLAGITKRPLVLFYHFFAVAFVSISGLFGDAGWRWPAKLGEATSVFWTACMVLLPCIFRELFV